MKRIRINTQLIDNRVFRTLFNTSTFRSVTLFKSAPNDIDRVNALRRYRYIAEERESVKSFNGQELNNIVKDAIAVRREMEK